MSGTDDERLFREMDNLELFLSGKRFNINDVLPTRQETGTVYRMNRSLRYERRTDKIFIAQRPGICQVGNIAYGFIGAGAH